MLRIGNLEALREIYQQYAFEVCAQFTYEGDSHKLLHMKNDLVYVVYQPFLPGLLAHVGDGVG